MKKVRLIKLIPVDGRGWLCQAFDVDGNNLYWGEYHASYYGCLEKYEQWKKREVAVDIAEQM